MKPAIITFAVSLLLILVVSMAYADEPQKVIDVQHDSVRGATCWILNDRAISCLPDSSLLQGEKSTRRENRASQTSLPSEKQRFGRRFAPTVREGLAMTIQTSAGARLTLKTEFESLGDRLIRFGQALQSETTTVAELTRLARSCGIALKLRTVAESGDDHD